MEPYIRKLLHVDPKLVAEQQKSVELVLSYMFSKLARNLRIAKALLTRDTNISDLLTETINNTYQLYEYIFRNQVLRIPIANLLLKNQIALSDQIVLENFKFDNTCLLLQAKEPVNIETFVFTLERNIAVIGMNSVHVIKSKTELDDLIYLRNLVLTNPEKSLVTLINICLYTGPSVHLDIICSSFKTFWLFD